MFACACIICLQIFLLWNIWRCEGQISVLCNIWHCGAQIYCLWNIWFVKYLTLWRPNIFLVKYLTLWRPEGILAKVSLDDHLIVTWSTAVDHCPTQLISVFVISVFYILNIWHCEAKVYVLSNIATFYKKYCCVWYT